MLADKKMFNIPKNKIGSVTSELIYYSIPFTLVTSFFTSYAFEILGRKWTMVLSYAITGFVYCWFPWTSPDYSWLIVARCTIAVTFAAPTMHPLINDYVSKSYRGRAIALNGFGMVFGELFAMGVLLKLTMNLSYHKAFFVSALVIWAFAIYFLIFLKDPDLSKARKKLDKDYEALSLCGKMTVLFKSVKSTFY